MDSLSSLDDRSVGKKYYRALRFTNHGRNFSMTKIPTVEQMRATVQRLINQYRNVQADESNYQQILQAVSDGLSGRSSTRETATEEQFYFRARMGRFEKSDPSQFSIPKPEYVSHGRCNLPECPVFYVGDNPDIAFLEIGARANDTVFLSLWRSRDSRPQLAQYGFVEENVCSEMAVDATKKIEFYRNIFRGAPEEILNHIIELQRSMATFLTAETWAISAALSHHEIYDNDIDGISYPDAKRGISYNYALSPSFSKQLELCGIWECVAPEIGKQIEIPSFGTLSNGQIEWRELKTNADVQEVHPLSLLKNILGGRWKNRVGPPKH